jgi:hypothetical protein
MDVFSISRFSRVEQTSGSAWLARQQAEKEGVISSQKERVSKARKTFNDPDSLEAT